MNISSKNHSTRRLLVFTLLIATLIFGRVQPGLCQLSSSPEHRTENG